MALVENGSKKKLFFSLLAFVLVGVTVVTLFVEAVFWFFSLSLPSLDSLSDYRPPIGSRVVLSDPTQTQPVVLAEFLKEKRYLATIDEMPKLLVLAFISAEDDQFFKHQGVNLTSILRAAFANLKAGHVVQGGSTITQQVAKSLLLTAERSFVRKAKEFILANRMERSLSKNEILYLYLNQIYLGHGAYGVKAAARTFFAKDLKDLSIAEMALLAGMPQAPGKFAPHQSPRKSKERQNYVLRRMYENGYVSSSQYDEAKSEILKIRTSEANPSPKVAPYLVEHLRRYVLNKYGEEKLYEGGLTIRLSGKLATFEKAQASLKDGLRALDKKEGFRGPIQHFKNEDEIRIFLQANNEELILSQTGYELLTTDGKLTAPEIKSEELVLFQNERYKAVVTGQKPLTFSITAEKRAVATSAPDAFIKSASLKIGDLVWVRITDNNPNKLVADLEQEPEVQGALYSMDLKTGQVLALEGGYDFKQSEFNRAIQAQRQPGSAFKPFIFAAALERGFTPVTNLVDAPLVYADEETGKWKPKNVDSKFYGDTSFRQALIKSRNIPTIKVVEAVGVQKVIEFAKRVGLNAQYAQDLSISLGSSATSLQELVKGYAVFARNGMKIEPRFFDEILDRDGQVLEKSLEAAPVVAAPPIEGIASAPSETATPSPEMENGGVPSHLATGVKFLQLPSYPRAEQPDQVMDPRVAFVLTHLMTEVVSYGTGFKAKALGRPVAGKTGTTDEARDAWFMGFTPEVVTGVWVGYDGSKTLPAGESGSSAALPIWVEVMKTIHEGMPVENFVVPQGIKFVKLSNGVEEAFIEGTEPGAHEFESAPGVEDGEPGQKKDYVPSQNDFLKEDTQ